MSQRNLIDAKMSPWLILSVCSAILFIQPELFASAFQPVSTMAFRPRSGSTNAITSIYSSTDNKESTSTSTPSAFVPIDDNKTGNEQEEDDDDDVLEKVEMFGKGAAKAKRGKRKGGESDGSVAAKQVSKASLAPEVVFYEGPPAITETLAPTLSILTVVGIIPAAAAWARQAWVRYKITNRRIRVTSGINGSDMAEIVYPDIVEIRTVRRLFGDGDMVAFLRDGARFEMRNIPNFVETMEFVLQHVSPQVATEYRSKGDVTKG